jgi:hypothetical protein
VDCVCAVHSAPPSPPLTRRERAIDTSPAQQGRPEEVRVLACLRWSQEAATRVPQQGVVPVLSESIRENRQSLDAVWKPVVVSGDILCMRLQSLLLCVNNSTSLACHGYVLLCDPG